MSKNRRTVAIDTDIVEELTKFAKERGMTLAGYVRSMFTSALQAERAGMYPPNLIKEAMSHEVLKRLGFLFVPSAVIFDDLSEDGIEEVGLNIGRALLEISQNPEEIFERYALSLKIAFPKDSSLLIPPVKKSGIKIKRLVIGMAKGLGLIVEESGDITVIRLRKAFP